MSDDDAPRGEYGQQVMWSPAKPRLRPLRLVLGWLVATVGIWLAAVVLPGVHVNSFEGALVVAALVGVLNAILPPVVAALRVPATLVIGFLGVLAVDAGILLLVSAIDPTDFKVDSFGWALLAALLMAVASLVLQTLLGVNDEDSYSLRVIERVAGRQGKPTSTQVPGILFLEIDGLAAVVLRRAMRDGNAPVLASWLERGTHRLTASTTPSSNKAARSKSSSASMEASAGRRQPPFSCTSPSSPRQPSRSSVPAHSTSFW
jgi:uncharacterized membrane protein YvlD (DUF360 family)